MAKRRHFGRSKTKPKQSQFKANLIQFIPQGNKSNYKAEVRAHWGNGWLANFKDY